MEYLRKPDWDRINKTKEHLNVPLIDRYTGATTAKITITKTPPGGGSPRGTHVHTFAHHQYILSGELTFEIEGVDHVATPGTLVFIPPGVSHRNRHTGSEPAVVLSVIAPPPALDDTRENEKSYVDQATGKWTTPGMSS